MCRWVGGRWGYGGQTDRKTGDGAGGKVRAKLGDKYRGSERGKGDMKRESIGTGIYRV